MKTYRRIHALLRREDGQSWVETVVMLPVIVAMLLGLFYLHDLVTTKIRAIEAARVVAWDSIWFGREDLPQRLMLPELLNEVPQVDPRLVEQAWKLRLQLLGLGRGLSHVDVFKRRIGQYASDVSTGGTPPTFFVPAAMGNLIGDTFGSGSDQSGGFVEGVANSMSGVLNGLLGLAGTASFFFQDGFAQNLNWQTEMQRSVYTARVIYNFGYTGFFAPFGTTTIVERASVLSHPYTLRRTNDDQEYTELLGNPCVNLVDESNGHVVKLWLFPSGGIPFDITGSGPSAGDTVNTIVNKVGDVGKCIIAGPGSLFSALDSLLGSNLGFTMPDGTLKEYPELSMPASSGVSSSNGSGASLGGCENGGGGALGSNSGFGGCP